MHRVHPGQTIHPTHPNQSHPIHTRRPPQPPRCMRPVTTPACDRPRTASVGKERKAREGTQRTQTSSMGKETGEQGPCRGGAVLVGGETAPPSRAQDRMATSVAPRERLGCPRDLRVREIRKTTPSGYQPSDDATTPSQIDRIPQSAEKGERKCGKFSSRPCKSFSLPN